MIINKHPSSRVILCNDGRGPDGFICCTYLVWCWEAGAYVFLVARLRVLEAGALRVFDAARFNTGLRDLETYLFAAGFRDFDLL